MNALHVRTPGLMCDECTSRVEKAVAGLSGVIGVTADHTDGATSVMFDENVVTGTTIAEAIRAAGFDVEPS